MDKKKVKIIFKDGKMEMIHNDEFFQKHVAEEFEIEKISRASHVEPMEDKPGLWYADLAPIGGPRQEEFKTRDEAIQFELDWINANYLKV